MRSATLLKAAAPAAASLLAFALVAVLGLSQRSAIPAMIEPYAYGFFLDRYPLFAFALVYGLARIAVAAAEPGAGSPLRRLAFGLAGLAGLTAVSLYPTFGGFVLRGGFGTGGMAFLSNQPLWLAYAIGAAVAAFAFGCATGVPIVLANRTLRPRPSLWRGLARGLWRALLSFLALWFAAALLGLARGEGIGPWPRRAFTAGEALRAGAILALAMAPHVLVTAFHARRRSA